jgi:hypothetical protein
MSYTTTALINNNKKEKKIYPKFSFKSAAQMQQGFADLSSSPLLSSLLLSLLNFSFFLIFMVFWLFFVIFLVWLVLARGTLAARQDDYNHRAGRTVRLAI